jgi:hypothetical protein
VVEHDRAVVSDRCAELDAVDACDQLRQCLSSLLEGALAKILALEADKARLKSAIACIHDRAQNASVKRLFELREASKLRAVVLPYLGQDDRRLKFRPADFS